MARPTSKIGEPHKYHNNDLFGSELLSVAEVTLMMKNMKNTRMDDMYFGDVLLLMDTKNTRIYTY